ncbi:MAG: DUF6377 domain-containing protein [Reichenbachiella sp.]|uniref:DUF6377 domain-containing protein n=1 Tax=Reichenbachiella sp. TaxID=2184521 RepID=UPI002965F647|nr:DUF6377 domain-containing protein [Reichenbachiella sp.]MDW3211854.1 DUF6377 domain-containing protein [Reichenbachiella sp.]
MRKVVTVILCFVCFTQIYGSDNLDSLYQLLESKMANRAEYEAAKLSRINNLKTILASEEISISERHHVINRLISEYSIFSFDSTLHYIDVNLSDQSILDNPEAFNETILIQATLFVKSGAYKESIDIISQVNERALDKTGKIRYYNVYRKIYEDLSFYTSLEKNRTTYDALYRAYSDSLTDILSKDSPEFLAIQEKEFRDSRQLGLCEDINRRRFENLEMGTSQYAMVAFERSLIYELKGQVENQIKYLILSACSDIQASIKDHASLTKLSLLLYENGQIEKAYKYIQFSSQDAEYFNSRLRFVEISNILPLITNAYQNIINEQNHDLKRYLLVISILFIVLAFLLYSTFRQVKKVRSTRNALHMANDSLKVLNEELSNSNQNLTSLNAKLVESDKVKEQYIANFLNICSEFIDKLENYQRMVKRLVSTRKFDKLMARASSQEFIDAEVEEFYKTFDTTFLHIYPDFVDRVNDLLEEDQKIILKKGEELNTELRIFALIRLGIDDSSQISKLLRYSVNTIYNYRAKVKNKAVSPREEFENRIMKIDAFTG